MRKSGKISRKLKSLALLPVLSSTILAAPLVRAAEQPEHNYNGGTASLQPASGNWFYSNSNVLNGALTGNGLFAMNSASGNIWTVSYGSAAEPQFVLGGVVSSQADTTTVENNRIDYAGGISPASYLIGGLSYSGAVTDNDVCVTDSTVSNYIHGGYSESSTAVSYNNVYITDSELGVHDYGGDSESSTAGSHNNNYLDASTRKGGTAAGCYSYSGDVTHNNICIIGGEMNYVIGGFSSSGDAKNNNVCITGGTVAQVYGGAVFSDKIATHNTVTLAGAITFEDITSYAPSVQGGFAVGSGDVFTGNTLNLNEFTQQGAISTVQNFNYYNFTVDAANANTNTFALTADSVSMTDKAEVRSIIITNGALAAGDAIGLIASGSDLDSQYGGDGKEISQTAGLFSYDFLIAAQNGGKELVATVKGVAADPADQSLSAVYLASTDFLNRGADLIERAVLKDAGDKTTREYGPAVFAATEYVDYRQGGNFRADTKGPVIAFGLAGAAQNKRGTSLVTGAFLEAGWGDYDGRGDYEGKTVKSGGSVDYRGIGFLARGDKETRGAGHTYTEGSVRTGRVKTRFDSLDLGSGARYDARAVYAGAHLGAGYIRELKGGASIDFYGKLLYTYTGGDTVNILGSEVEFDAAYSLRARAGLRYGKTIKEKNSFYLGLAYEYEFAGEQRAFAAGLPIDAPDIKGGTGIGEIGLTVRRQKHQFDLKAEGYAGKRKGFGLSADIKWFF